MIKPAFKFCLILLSSLIFFDQSAFAIRSVGNGGGLAEMRMIYLFQNMDRFLRVCLTPENSCDIEEATAREWSVIAAEKPNLENELTISFVIDELIETGFSLVGNGLKISHRWLYDDSKNPKKLGELLAYAVTIKQVQFRSKAPFQKNLDIASTVFGNMKFQESSSKVTGITYLIHLNQIRVFDGLVEHVMIGLEDEEKTLNLNAIFTQALPCGSLSDWTMNQWNSSVIGTKVYFYGFASAKCAGGIVQRKVLLKAELLNNLINEKTLQVGFYSNQ